MTSRAKTTATQKAQVFDLDAIRVALEDNDASAGLEAALVAWRQTRAPALAGLIDAIAARLEQSPIESESAWNAAARGRGANDVEALLTAIPNLPASFLPTAGAALAGFPDDPRIAMAIATWTVDPPTTSS